VGQRVELGDGDADLHALNEIVGADGFGMSPGAIDYTDLHKDGKHHGANLPALVISGTTSSGRGTSHQGNNDG